MGRHRRRCLYCQGPARTWTLPPGPTGTPCCPSLCWVCYPPLRFRLVTKSLLRPFGSFLCYFFVSSCIQTVQLCISSAFTLQSVTQVPSKNMIKGPKNIRLNFDYWLLMELFIVKPFILNQIAFI